MRFLWWCVSWLTVAVVCVCAGGKGVAVAADGTLSSGSQCRSSDGSTGSRPSSAAGTGVDHGGRGAPRGANGARGAGVGQGVGGGNPPPRLDTQGIGDLHRAIGGSQGDLKESPGAIQPRGAVAPGSGRGARHYQRRQRLARPSRASLTPWREGYADALAGLGWSAAAADARGCGSQSFVSACGACGVEVAAVRVSLHCSLRACPLCARRTAAERVRLVTGAALRVAGFVRERSAGVLSRLGAAVASAREAVDLWHGRAERASERGAEELADRHRGREAAAEGRRRSAAWSRSRAGEWASWRWSLLTVSPAWRPLDPVELTVEGLRRRIADAWVRWERVWARLAAGGLAAATARLEVSAHGHVHVHAVVFGGFVGNAALRAAAGCHVDRRAPGPRPGVPAHRVVEDLVREACKYALKAPSSLRAGWVGGSDARSGVSLHPELAARLTVALHREQTVIHYGVMREAVRAESAAQPEGVEDDALAGQSAARCPCCGAHGSLLPPMIRNTAEVARELGSSGWSWVGRAPPRVEGSGASERLPPRVGLYWRTG